MRYSNLWEGRVSSCGCLYRETRRAAGIKHGLSRTREFVSWVHARGRCYNPRNAKFRRYGGRGIVMCDRWRESFEAFLADMGPCPEGYSLNRIDNDGPYAPENCEWATAVTQSNNRRTSARVTFDGATRTVAEWERRLGWRPGALKRRMQRGWTLHDAFTRPLRRWPTGHDSPK